MYIPFYTKYRTLQEDLKREKEKNENLNLINKDLMDSKHTKTIDGDRLYLNSDTSLMNYLKIVESYKYNIRLEELKEEKEE